MFASNEVTKSNLYQPKREVKIYCHKIAAVSMHWQEQEQWTEAEGSNYKDEVLVGALCID